MSNMNFTCDVCGREVFSCTFVNGMKFCAKCYQETFGETDKDRKIADLEAKLAESKKQCQECKHLAIEQLEKVEEILWNSQDIGNVIDNDKFLEKLNYLIKSLKGEK